MNREDAEDAEDCRKAGAIARAARGQGGNGFQDSLAVASRAAVPTFSFSLAPLFAPKQSSTTSASSAETHFGTNNAPVNIPGVRRASRPRQGKLSSRRSTTRPSSTMWRSDSTTTDGRTFGTIPNEQLLDSGPRQRQ